MIADSQLKPANLSPLLERFFDLTGRKILALDRDWNRADGSPVFTVKGRYTSRGWTEWTEGFQYGCALLQFDATGDERFYRLGRERTLANMPPHLTHSGVHDHGFNNLSTYGNLRRLALEGRTDENADAREMFALAVRVSGAVQASRWTPIADGTGFVHSFNGPHSLFCDTIRSCRILVLAHHLGQKLMGEGDRAVSLLARAADHLGNTCKYNVYYGEARDHYDLRGRVAHETLWNTVSGAFRCPSTQQGYSAFTTWTRGLAWVMLGAAEELEFLKATSPKLNKVDSPYAKDLVETLERAARATCDFYIKYAATDGIPYWDTGAPGLVHMPDLYETASRPDNPHEPVDSSAAAIAAQGLLRLGRYLGARAGKRYVAAGLSVAQTLFSPPYLSESPKHHGLLLHSVYHRPNGWDHVPRGKKIPQGESSMWGDYHAMELAVYLQRLISGGPYLTFFGPHEM